MVPESDSREREIRGILFVSENGGLESQLSTGSRRIYARQVPLADTITIIKCPRKRKPKSMPVAPEVPPMLKLRIVQLTLLTSLAFGVGSNVFSAPLAAEGQQDLPATIPDLSGYDRETRQSIELACIVKKSDGPVAYGTCLNRQIASLQGSPGIPSLSDYDRETRQSIELACIVKKSDGPVAYGTCLNRQIASLQGSPGIPSLSDYDRETRQSIELACIVKKSDGPVAYGTCLNRQIASLQGSRGIPNLNGHDGETRQLEPPTPKSDETNSDTLKSRAPAVHSVNAMSRFTSENILKVHQGMSSNKILEMFGTPKNVSQLVCGASAGKWWACTTWEYGELPYGWASFTFSGNSGSLILNNFDVHRE